MSRFEFEIPASNLMKFKTLMLKVDRKSVKLGFDHIQYIVSARIISPAKGEFFKIYIDTPAFKINGWDFVATIDHTHDTGNIVRCMPCETVPENFRTEDPVCEHCHVNRFRRNTYVLRNETTYKQVGKTCLNDFIGAGHDPAKMARLAVIISQMQEDVSKLHTAQSFTPNFPTIDMEKFTACTAAIVRKYGWVSRKKATETGMRSTSDMAIDFYYSRFEDFVKLEILPEDQAVAASAIEWAQQIADKQDKNDYEHNISVIADAEFITNRSVGLAASIVGVYMMNQKNAAPKQTNVSDFIGKIGDKIEVQVTVLLRKPLDTGSILWKFEDENQNVLTWFATTSNGPADGTTAVLKGTVKKHDEFRGVKSTLVTRCKFLEA
jgi:hypothetical protein